DARNTEHPAAADANRRIDSHRSALPAEYSNESKPLVFGRMAAPRLDNVI
ncbi:MAG: hypothetical protein JWQ11_2646, partial [Rhizobacter sp.]|nr:hypothetical protein [Rhizobacter sp.]